MGLETTTYINGLIATNPLLTDSVSQGDDHIRLLKSSILNTFPNLTGAMNASQTELNYSVGVTGDIQAQLATKAGLSDANNFSENQTIEKPDPILEFHHIVGLPDVGRWQMQVESSYGLSFRGLTDAGIGSLEFFSFGRSSGSAVASFDAYNGAIKWFSLDNVNKKVDLLGDLTLDKGILDEPFIDFVATADADATSAISTLTTSGATTHHIQIEINGVTAWIPCSTVDPT